jgi:hypothetical protein
MTPVSVRPGINIVKGNTGLNNKQICRVYDLKGRTVATLDVREGANVVDVLRLKNSLPAGTYLLLKQDGVMADAQKFIAR